MIKINLSKIATIIPEYPYLIDPSFSKFPDWRPNQVEALGKLLKSEKPIMILEGPTGCGKSLIAESYAILSDCSSSVYSTPTKTLQDQLARDFGVDNGGIAEVLKGRANYDCPLIKGKQADSCVHSSKDPCPCYDRCPYQTQKAKAFASKQVILNLHGLITHLLYTENLENRDLLILDEGDNLEDVLTQFCTKVITSNQLTKLHQKLPDWDQEEEDWINWVEKTYVSVQHRYSDLTEDADDSTIERHLSMLQKLSFLIDNFDDGWGVYVDSGEFGMFVQFIPLDISGLAQSFIFSKFKKVLLMSATFCAIDVFASTHGLKDFRYASMKSTFPKEKRPIYYVPITYANSNIGDSEKQELADSIDFILSEIRNGTPHNAIIHTTSKWLANDLQSRCETPMELYTSGREDLLKDFKAGEIHTMISPSLVRGFDFPDDECRINIVAKLPYPYLGDPVVDYRKAEIPGWYNWRTVVDLVQETGRSTRSEKDYSITFILDMCFDYFTKSRLIPRWWKEAVTTITSEDQINQELLEGAKNG